MLEAAVHISYWRVIKQLQRHKGTQRDYRAKTMTKRNKTATHWWLTQNNNSEKQNNHKEMQNEWILQATQQQRDTKQQHRDVNHYKN